MAAETLGRTAAVAAVPKLLDAAARIPERGSVSATGSPEDQSIRVAEHAIIHAMIQIGATEPLFESLKLAREPRRTRAALVALDQLSPKAFAATDVLPFLSATSPLVQRTAGWIAARRADWGPALTGYFESRLGQPPKSPAEVARLEGQLKELARSPAIQGVLAKAVTTGTEAAVISLRAMATAG